MLALALFLSKMHMQFTFERPSETNINITLKIASIFFTQVSFVLNIFSSWHVRSLTEKVRTRFCLFLALLLLYDLGQITSQLSTCKRETRLHTHLTGLFWALMFMKCYEMLSATKWRGLSIIVSKTQAAEIEWNLPSFLTGHVLSCAVFSPYSQS